jgi:hypothetical protein
VEGDREATIIGPQKCLTATHPVFPFLTSNLSFNISPGSAGFIMTRINENNAI